MGVGSRSFVWAVREQLTAGKNVVVHCRQSVGRSGLLAIAVLLSAGAALAESIEAVTRARGCAVPETQEQLHWLKHVAKTWR